MTKKTILANFIIFYSISSFAQANDSLNLQFIERYKENRQLSYTSPLSEIGAPSKYILSGKLTTTYMLLASKKLPVAFAVIPDFTVRVRNEKSAGVRTPSFRLGGATYVRLNNNLNNYKYAEIGFTHHSNGQDANAINTDGTINTYNGNFSTNYLTASYNFGNFTNHAAGKNYSSYNHKVGLEWHKWFAYEKALEDNYGFTRLNYNFSLRKYTFYKPKSKEKTQLEKEYLRLNADVSYAVNSISNSPIKGIKKRLNAELTANYSLPFMQNVFLMATAGYYGEDPYNIYFSDHYGFLRFGISTGFLKYKVKP
ncbi:hypothetical protein [Pedobacter alpinus]|uniref:Phosphatidylcholine 1-acylhydrolase n=1 Tax=Pedobacter alpinus TaxID=1590643 RepID=A0ABW5TVD4_9SPHI